MSSCGPIRSCAWRTAEATGRPICLGDRDGDPCGRRAETELAGMRFCRSCALRIAAAVSKHEDLSLLDTDAIEQKRKQRQHVSRQLCYAALTQGYLEIALSVDPEGTVGKRPGTRLLFVLEGHGPRVQHEVHQKLRGSRAPELGNNFFRLTEETIDWLSDDQETVLDMRTTHSARKPV